jgi:predicted methyltransferase
VRLILPVLTIALIICPADAASPPKKPHAAAASKPTAKPAPRPAAAIDPDIQRAVLDPGRKPGNAARDKYRHPAETLSFFGLKPDMTVVEMIPGGGWYSEILAPYLADSGHYVAAVEPGDPETGFRLLISDNPDRLGKAAVVQFTQGEPNALVPPGTADMILTFRNIHNLLGSPEQPGYGNAPQAFAD